MTTKRGDAIKTEYIIHGWDEAGMSDPIEIVRDGDAWSAKYQGELSANYKDLAALIIDAVNELAAEGCTRFRIKRKTN